MAQEEVFEPSMLSDDLPAVGALLSEQREAADDERQPWHFESDDTLVIAPEPGLEPEPAPEPAAPPADESLEPDNGLAARIPSPVAASRLRRGGLAPVPAGPAGAEDARPAHHAFGRAGTHRQREHRRDGWARHAAWPSARACCSAWPRWSASPSGP